MKPTKTLSIRAHVGRAQAQAMVITMLLIGTLFLAVNFQSVQNRFQDRSEDLFNIAQTALIRPLWNVDKEEVEKIIATLLADEAIVYVKLSSDAEINVTASEKDFSYDALPKSGSNLQFIRRITDIRFNEEVIGNLVIVMSSQDLITDLVFTAISTVIFILITIAVLLAVTFQIYNRLVFSPLEDLRHAAEAIADGNLQTRIPRHKTYEMDKLAIAFATMRESIESLVNDLRASNDSLERVVRLRTQQLEESEKRVSAVLDNVVDGIITLDSYGEILSINSAVTEIFGYQKNEVVGKPVSILLPPTKRSVLMAPIVGYAQDKDMSNLDVELEIEGLRKNGEVFPGESAISLVPLEEDEIFAVIFRDITKRKEVDRLKSEFVSTVSHELRTPLTSILGSLKLIKGGALGEVLEKTGSMIDIAEKNTQRLINLVNDILDMEKLNSGRLEYQFQEVNLAELVHESIESNKGFADEFKVALDYVPHDGPLAVWGDPSRLDQVLANLLSNAIKFSPENSTVSIHATLNNNTVRVEVRDKGPGISDEDRPLVFRRFSQIDASDTRNVGGKGLGLSISKAIIGKHQGIIDFDSTPGEGTTFYFELPTLRSGLREAAQ